MKIWWRIYPHLVPLWWLKLWLPVQHRFDYRSNPEEHKAKCVCHGTGRLPR